MLNVWNEHIGSLVCWFVSLFYLCIRCYFRIFSYLDIVSLCKSSQVCKVNMLWTGLPSFVTSASAREPSHFSPRTDRLSRKMGLWKMDHLIRRRILPPRLTIVNGMVLWNWEIRLGHLFFSRCHQHFVMVLGLFRLNHLYSFKKFYDKRPIVTASMSPHATFWWLALHIFVWKFLKDILLVNFRF